MCYSGTVIRRRGVKYKIEMVNYYTNFSNKRSRSGYQRYVDQYWRELGKANSKPNLANHYKTKANRVKYRAKAYFPRLYKESDFAYTTKQKKVTTHTYTEKSAAKHNQTIDPNLTLDDEHIQKYGIIFHVERNEQNVATEVYVWVNHGDHYDYTGSTDVKKSGTYGKFVGKTGFAIKLKVDPETQLPISSNYTLLKRDSGDLYTSLEWIIDSYATVESLPVGSYIKMTESVDNYSVVVEEDDFEDDLGLGFTYTIIDGINSSLDEGAIYKIFDKDDDNFYVYKFNEEFGFSELVQIPGSDLTTTSEDTGIETPGKFIALQREPQMVTTPSLMPIIAYNRKVETVLNDGHPKFTFAIANSADELNTTNEDSLISDWKYVGVFQKYNGDTWEHLGGQIFGWDESPSTTEYDFASKETVVNFDVPTDPEGENNPTVPLQNGKYRFGVKAVFTLKTTTENPNPEPRSSDFKYAEFEINVLEPAIPIVSIDTTNGYDISGFEVDPRNDVPADITYTQQSGNEFDGFDLSVNTVSFTGDESVQKPVVWTWPYQENITYDVFLNVSRDNEFLRTEFFYGSKHNIFSVNNPMEGETYELLVMAFNSLRVQSLPGISMFKLVDNTAPTPIRDLTIAGSGLSKKFLYKSDSNDFISKPRGVFDYECKENDIVYQTGGLYFKLESNNVHTQTDISYVYSKNGDDVILNKNIELHDISEFQGEAENAEIGAILGETHGTYNILSEEQLGNTSSTNRHRVVAHIKDNNGIANSFIGLQKAELEPITTANHAVSLKKQYTWNWTQGNATKWRCTLSKKINIKSSESHINTHFVLTSTNESDSFEIVEGPMKITRPTITFDLESNNLYKLSIVAMDDAENEASAVESLIYLVEDTDADGVLDANEYFSHKREYSFKESYLKNETVALEHNELKKNDIIEIYKDLDSIFNDTSHTWTTISPNRDSVRHPHVYYAVVETIDYDNNTFSFSYLGQVYSAKNKLLNYKGEKWQIIGSPTDRIPLAVTDSSIHSKLLNENDFDIERTISASATLKLLWKFNGTGWNQTEQTIIEEYLGGDLTQEQLKCKFVVKYNVNNNAFSELENLIFYTDTNDQGETIFYTLIDNLELGSYNFKIFTKNVSNNLLSAEHIVDTEYTIDKDSDGDGVLDDEDPYPENANLAYNKTDLGNTSKWFVDTIRLPNVNDVIRISHRNTLFDNYISNKTKVIPGRNDNVPYYVTASEVTQTGLLFLHTDGQPYIAYFSDRGTKWNLLSQVENIDEVNASLNDPTIQGQYDNALENKLVEEDYIPVIGEIIKFNQTITLKNLAQDEKQFESGTYANIVLLTSDKKYLAIKSGILPSESESSYYIELNQDGEQPFYYQTLKAVQNDN